MPYAPQDQLELAAGGAAKFVQLADLDGNGASDAAFVTRSQAAADGWLDGYIRARHATPIANPSATLIQMAADETIYRMRKARQMVTDDDRLDHQEREKWCEAVATGKVRIDEPLPLKSTAVKSAWVSGDSKAVSREGTKGFW